MVKYRIAVFPGDGIGPELIDEGIKIIEKAAELDKFEVEFIKYPYGAEHFEEINEHLTNKTLKEIKDSCRAIYCGTFDFSKTSADKNVPALIKSYFAQTINLRSIRLLPGIESSISGKTDNDINFTVIRENSEDFYVGLCGRAKNGKTKQQFECNNLCKAKFNLDIETKGNEIAYQIGILSKKGCEKVVRYAFNYAKNNNINQLTAVDKANMLNFYGIWRECFEKAAKDNNGIKYEFELIDSTIMNLIRQPEKYKIIVAPNLFGGILSDLGTMLQGGLTYGARANINPDGISMFEPIHGCAPKLKGQGIVNPIATVWAGALMLESIGQKKSSDLILKSIEGVLKDGKTRTQDLNGNNSTSEMGDAIKEKFVELHD